MVVPSAQATKISTNAVHTHITTTVPITHSIAIPIFQNNCFLTPRLQIPPPALTISHNAITLPRDLHTFMFRCPLEPTIRHRLSERPTIISDQHHMVLLSLANPHRITSRGPVTMEDIATHQGNKDKSLKNIDKHQENNILPHQGKKQEQHQSCHQSSRTQSPTAAVAVGKIRPVTYPLGTTVTLTNFQQAHSPI